MSATTLAPATLTLTADERDRLVQGLLSIDSHLGYVQSFAQLDLDEACALGCAQASSRELLQALGS